MDEHNKLITHQMAIAANENIKEKEYWLNNLADAPVEPCTGFPYDHAASGTGQVETVPFQFPAPLGDRLMKLRNNNDVRLNMVLLSGISLLLSKYTGTGDVVAGMPIYKQEQDIEFINTILPVRTRIENTSTFKELLLATRESIGKAVEHQNYPFPVLMEQLSLPFTGGLCPLFNVMVLLENIHDEGYIKNMETAVTVTFRRDDTAVSGRWQYRADLYNRSTIEQISRHFMRIMETVLLNVDIAAADIQLLEDAERRMIVEDFNGSKADLHIDRPLHVLFEEQVVHSPNNPAILGGGTDEPVTYSQLNGLANRIAHHLREMGAGPGLLIGLMVEPSWRMPAAILGILKSGAAYLPIDIDYPDERIRFMMTDSAAPILVKSVVMNDFSWFTGQILDLDVPGVFEGSAGNLEPASSAGDPAYVIYTSGTTGRPKGVLVEHRQVTAYLQSFFDQFEIGPDDVSIHLTSIAFDAFVEEMYPVLLKGGAFGIPGRNDMLDITRLTEFMKTYNVTMVDCTPLMLNELDKTGESLPQRLRIVISGGDVLKPDYVSRLKETGGLWNTYGPTESTVCAAYYHYTGENNEETIPIGKPILNYNIYILDKNNCLLPPGIGGEIGVSGPGVTRGYLNRPGLTHERFIPDPVNPQLRMYLTGDRGKWLPDGNIQFLGRMDRQVKIRGYRIETAEIENRLARHPAVTGAVVTVRVDNTGEKYLVAYVTPDDTDELVLRQYLMERLPDYMVPQFFVAMDQFPLTPSGKIDVRALPEPHSMSKAEYVEPRTDTERAIRDIWQDVFGFERIGIHDNFFEIGGHSLKGIQVINGIHKVLNVKIGVENIFRFPTIAQLAEIVDASKGETYSNIEPQPERDYYESSYVQKRFWVLWQLNPGSVAYNMYSQIPLPQGGNVQVLEEAFRRMIQRHDSFRTAFKEVDGILVQEVKPEVPFHLEFVDLSDLPEVEEATALERETDLYKNIQFDLGQAPILKVKLLVTRESTELLIVTHHIVADGSSTGVFIREFTEIYSALAGGREPVLEPIPVQYKDFAHWQNRLLEKGEAVDRAMAFWKEQLEGDLDPLPLPYDFAVDRMQTRESSGYTFLVPDHIKDRLVKIAHDANATLFMVMLAGINLLFSFFTGRSDIIIGGPGEARQHDNLKNIIGLFANTLVFRTQVDRQESFTDFLNRVREETLQVLEYQSYPLELVCDELDMPFPELPVFFNMLKPLEEVEAMHSGETSSHLHGTLDAKTDLSFYIMEFKDSIDIFCLYCSELFKPEKVEKMVKTYGGILEKIAEDPTLPLGKYKVKSGRRSRQGSRSQEPA